WAGVLIPRWLRRDSAASGRNSEHGAAADAKPEAEVGAGAEGAEEPAPAPAPRRRKGAAGREAPSARPARYEDLVLPPPPPAPPPAAGVAPRVAPVGASGGNPRGDPARGAARPGAQEDAVLTTAAARLAAGPDHRGRRARVHEDGRMVGGRAADRHAARLPDLA